MGAQQVGEKLSPVNLAPGNEERAGLDPASAFHQIADSRRSIRNFLPDLVPPEVLERCLDSALKAPSSSNLQHWEFIIIRNPETRAQANHVCLDQKLLQSAPLLVAVVAHTRSWQRNCRFILDTLEARGILRKSQARYWGKLMPFMYRQDPFGLFGCLKHAAGRVVSLFRPSPSFHSKAELRVTVHKSTALAAATFMLALRAEGYDSCPIEGFDPWRAKKVLKLSPGAEVCMFLAIGKRGDKAIWWDRILLPKAWTVREI
jgi:nitroreductase